MQPGMRRRLFSASPKSSPRLVSSDGDARLDAVKSELRAEMRASIEEHFRTHRLLKEQHLQGQRLVASVEALSAAVSALAGMPVAMPLGHPRVPMPEHARAVGVAEGGSSGGAADGMEPSLADKVCTLRRELALPASGKLTEAVRAANLTVGLEQPLDELTSINEQVVHLLSTTGISPVAGAACAMHIGRRAADEWMAHDATLTEKMHAIGLEVGLPAELGMSMLEAIEAANATIGLIGSGTISEQVARLMTETGTTIPPRVSNARVLASEAHPVAWSNESHSAVEGPASDGRGVGGRMDASATQLGSVAHMSTASGEHTPPVEFDPYRPDSPSSNASSAAYSNTSVGASGGAGGVGGSGGRFRRRRTAPYRPDPHAPLGSAAAASSSSEMDSGRASRPSGDASSWLAGQDVTARSAASWLASHQPPSLPLPPIYSPASSPHAMHVGTASSATPSEIVSTPTAAAAASLDEVILQSGDSVYPGGSSGAVAMAANALAAGQTWLARATTTSSSPASSKQTHASARPRARESPEASAREGDASGRAVAEVRAAAMAEARADKEAMLRGFEEERQRRAASAQAAEEAATAHRAAVKKAVAFRLSVEARGELLRVDERLPSSLSPRLREAASRSQSPVYAVQFADLAKAEEQHDDAYEGVWH